MVMGLGCGVLVFVFGDFGVGQQDQFVVIFYGIGEGIEIVNEDIVYVQVVVGEQGVGYLFCGIDQGGGVVFVIDQFGDFGLKVFVEVFVLFYCFEQMLGVDVLWFVFGEVGFVQVCVGVCVYCFGFGLGFVFCVFEDGLE